MKRITLSKIVFEATLFALVAGSLLCACRNPFFPVTGIPDKGNSLRATPEGVLQQLVQAYEQKDINLYMDLFPLQKTFQFYVSPKFVPTYQSRSYSSAYPPEPRYTLLHFIGEYSYYYYWGQDREVASHRNLFNKVDLIQFQPQPNIRDIRYIVSLVNGKPDTTNVEMEVTDGEIIIDVTAGSLIDEYTIYIDRQVFFLERDASRLWLIRKWYDFGNQE
jgi:hypothetical protein